MLLSEDIVKLGISEFTEPGGITPSEVGPRLSGRPWLPENDMNKERCDYKPKYNLIGKRNFNKMV